MVIINGEKVPEAQGQTVQEYLTGAGFPEGGIAVERNEEILPKAACATTTLQDGDVLEIVTFMGGGC